MTKPITVSENESYTTRNGKSVHELSDLGISCFQTHPHLIMTLLWTFETKKYEYGPGGLCMFLNTSELVKMQDLFWGQWVYIMVYLNKGDPNIPWIFLFPGPLTAVVKMAKVGLLNKHHIEQILHLPWELKFEDY